MRNFIDLIETTLTPTGPIAEFEAWLAEQPWQDRVDVVLRDEYKGIYIEGLHCRYDSLSNGIGRSVMAKLIEIADRDALTLQLEASREGSHFIRAWYRRLGFKGGYGSGDYGPYMIREPKKARKKPAAVTESVDSVPVLYHGTCFDNAESLIANGWEPRTGRIGGANMGQPRYLYLSTGYEDALWFANEKGCEAVIEVRDVPISHLMVDPEDGYADTLEDELKGFGDMPGKVVLTKPLSPSHFRLATKP